MTEAAKQQTAILVIAACMFGVFAFAYRAKIVSDANDIFMRKEALSRVRYMVPRPPVDCAVDAEEYAVCIDNESVWIAGVKANIKARNASISNCSFSGGPYNWTVEGYRGKPCSINGKPFTEYLEAK